MKHIVLSPEKVFGKNISIYIHEDKDLISSYIESNKHFFEQTLLHHMAQRYQLQGLVIDIGANIGNHTVFLAEFMEAEQIHAFEPLEKNFKILKRNADKYPDKITCHNVALGASNGTINMRLPMEHNYGMAREVWPNETCTDSFEVECCTLDSFEFQDVSLIKVDVETFEPHVLIGAAKTIRRCKPVVIVEGTEALTIWSIVHVMAKLNYVCRNAIDPQNPMFEFAPR